MSWISDAADLRARRIPSVLVTLAARRGHAPREAGAKMLVTGSEIFGSVGGGNLEAGAVDRAREMLAAAASGPPDSPPSGGPEFLEFALNEHAPYEHGRQCCGGEVTVFLEPLPVPPAVAVFGCGHVGLELARILSRQDADLWFCDSRPEAVDAVAAEVNGAPASVRMRHSMVPEEVVDELPRGCHVVVMTHDHGEDLHLCQALLTRARASGDLGSVGLIGSSAKWARFRMKLGDAGFTDGEINSIRCPVGIPDLGGRHPATIAVSIAADLLQRM
ncbi:xanthine dehydrogenase accessory protein XdhC [Corynebacterium provencense]|uniref:xanthine dehydrogenase accessory protein XdhC n=1 Tax=Corynebacterium provencense TaxID=1737425 RepID=UPI00082B3A12|nr:xanthine dehydrogenase accessory protein XdhC [Corynebacterium provencense]